MNVILLQVDDVRVKPVSSVDVTKLINEKLSNSILIESRQPILDSIH
jgi:hypothetical protein